jgi:hypothetical protein
MNGRRLVWLAFAALSVALVAAAMSTAADPGDINNPPTKDWFFDSGTTVTINNKVWDINYNITVANFTTLVFSDCTFTFSDPDDLNSRWIDVWWNGSMEVYDCTFKSSGQAKYYIMLNNDTTFMGSTISGMLPWSSGEGGITAWNSDIVFKNTTLKDTPDYHALVTYACNVDMDGFTVTNAGSLNSGRAAVWIEIRYRPMDEQYLISIANSNFNDNLETGLRFYLYDNWADITIDISNSNFNRNGREGIYTYWRYGRNSTFEMTMSDCVFMNNHNSGVYFYGSYFYYDGTGTADITVERCTFEANNDGGYYTYFYNMDGEINFLFEDTIFQDNGQAGTGWSYGGMYLDNSRIYGSWNVMVDGCTFDNNAEHGMRIYHTSTDIDDSSYTIMDTTFSDNRDYGVWMDMNTYYQFFAVLGFDLCTFTDNGKGGIHIQHQNLNNHDYILSVTDSTFSGGGSGVTSDSYSWSSGAKDVYWEITGCTFDDLSGFAISLFLDNVMGDSSLMIEDCDLSHTGGIAYRVLGSYSNVQAHHDLSLIDVSILNTPAAGVDTHVIGYYGVELDVYLEDVTVTDAFYNGIKATTATDYGSASNSIEMEVEIINVDISAIGGNGLNLGSERVDYAGTRTIDVVGLDIANTQKAMIISSLKGEFRDTTLANSLKQDLTVITSDLELYQPKLDELSADKVQVIESGSVKFWYTLKVYVNWDTGVAVKGAVVSISDNQHTLIGVYTQEDDTGLPELMLNSYQFRETGQFTRSPYILNVTSRAIQKFTAVTLDGDKIVTIELADHMPPKIFINEPMQDHIQQSTTIKVRGSAFDTESDVDMVEVSIDGTTWMTTATTTSWEYTFFVSEDDVRDAGGVFTIRARATDLAGNVASTITRMEIDPFPPELRVDYPYNDLQTNEPTISVRGVTEAGATVMVNGVDITVAGTLFVAMVDLVEGPNTITIAAFDALGNSNQMKMEVVLDTKPPYLVLLTPEEGEMFTEPTCDVSGQAEDDLTIMVNGNTLGGAHYDNGTFSYAVSLSRGDNVIVVEATDMAGNKVSTSRRVILDDVVPMLAIQSPADGSSQNSMTIMVIGTTDPDGMLLINDELVDLDHGLFSYPLVGVEGANLITLSASDVAGNVVEISLTVSIDTVGPTLDILTPADDYEMVTGSTFTISGDAEGASRVWINGEEHPVVDDMFSVEVSLLEGENRFIVTIEDAAGNSMTDERRVTLDTVAPVLVIRLPDAQTNKNGDLVFRTKSGKASNMVITGFTNEAVRVSVNGELVPVSADGYFYVDHQMIVKSANSIVIVAEDAAGNTASWNETVTHEIMKDPGDETIDMGFIILIVGMVVLVIAILVGYRRLNKAEEAQEMRYVEEDEVLAPAAMPEVEEEEELEEEEEELEEEEEIVIDEEDEEIHELTPPGERPRTDTSRPISEPEPSEEVTIEIDEKDLEEKDAEADAEADESEQEEVI